MATIPATCPGNHTGGDVWCEQCGHGLPADLEDGPGACPCCGTALPDRRCAGQHTLDGWYAWTDAPVGDGGQVEVRCATCGGIGRITFSAAECYWPSDSGEK